MVIVYIAALVLIFYLLAKVSDQYFVESLDIIAKKWKLSDDVAGATLMAIGSSAPEFFTAVVALGKIGSEQIGAGTIVGSAIFNVLVIVGMSSIVATAYLNWRPVIRDLLFYISSILLLLITFQDGVITTGEASIYLFGYGLYVFLLSRWSKWFPDKKITSVLVDEVDAYKEEEQKLVRTGGIIGRMMHAIDIVLSKLFPAKAAFSKKYWRVFIVSIIMIAFLSWALVEIAVLMAHSIGIPEVIIALTILAGGTSIPDLLGSLIVSKKGRGDMAVSNAVGSNTFDIFIGLGLPWFVYTLFLGKNVIVGTENLFSSILLLLFTVITLLFLLIVQKFKIGRNAGYVLLCIYAAYLGYSIYGAYVPGAWTLGEFLMYGGQVLGVT